VNDTIDQARRDVHRLVSEMLEVVDTPDPQRLASVERQLWTMVLGLGRALIALFLMRQAARPRATDYRHGRIRWYLSDWRETPVGTLFGKVAFLRPIGRRHGQRRAAADLVVDRELGLVSGFSAGVTLEVARLCALMPYGRAREEFERVHQWAPSPRATMRIVDAVGTRARPFLEDAAPPEDDGEVLVVSLDGGAAPMISPWELEARRQPKRSAEETRTERRARRAATPKTRRGPGEKSKNGKSAFVGVIYTLRHTPTGYEGPINKQLVGTFESHDQACIWLRHEADKRGYATKECLFLGDGSEHIWRCQEAHFREATPCLDWYHLMEYVWKAGRAIFSRAKPKVTAGKEKDRGDAKGSGRRSATKAPDQIRAWVKEQSKRLRNGEVAAVLAELGARLQAVPRTGPGSKGRRETLATVLGYFETHKGRMPYASFLERGLDIGSGAVEGAIRNAVRMRLDGPGMRWGRQRSEYILHLRCVILNGKWDAFDEHLETTDLSLPAQPTPAQPFAAKAA